MRILALIVLCFVLGFVLGRWTPETELQRAKAELAEAKTQARSGGTAGLAGVTQLLQIDRSEPAASPIEAPVEVTSTNAPVDEVAPVELAPRKSLAEEIEKASELWNVRRDIAFGSFIDNLDATREEELRFAVLTEAMNIRLQAGISNWVERVETQGVIRPEDGARLFHQLTGDIVLTYDEMGDSFGEGWQERAGDNFKLFDFVDPAVGSRLISIEGLMEDAEGRF